MSSFATNAVCAHQPLCTREAIEETVDTLSEALDESTAPDLDVGGVGQQMKLTLVSSRTQGKKTGENS